VARPLFRGVGFNLGAPFLAVLWQGAGAGITPVIRGQNGTFPVTNLRRNRGNAGTGNAGTGKCGDRRDVPQTNRAASRRPSFRFG
jgi:hypothetical protein